MKNPTSSVQGQDPPSPLIPTDESPRPPNEGISDDEDELPYPYPNPDLRKGKHHGSMRPPTISEELWEVATKDERQQAWKEFKDMELEREKKKGKRNKGTPFWIKGGANLFGTSKPKLLYQTRSAT